jgi:hypothetical protein
VDGVNYPAWGRFVDKVSAIFEVLIESYQHFNHAIQDPHEIGRLKGHFVHFFSVFALTSIWYEILADQQCICNAGCL